MPGLSPDLSRRLRETLSRCVPFDSDRALRAVFVDARIVPWRDLISDNTPNRAARVDALIEALLEQVSAASDSALALFLDVLADRTASGDACKKRLARLATELRQLRPSPTEAKPAPSGPVLQGGKYENVESVLGNIHSSGDSQALLNLPARRYTYLLGRDKDIEVIQSCLRAPYPSPLVMAITGLGGIGKTALAYEVAVREIESRFFESVVWDSAKSEEFEAGHIIQRPHKAKVISFESLVNSIAKQLNRESWLNLPFEERVSRVKELLSKGAYLIVVDNIETMETYKALAYQLHEVLGSTQSLKPSRALLTSRERLSDVSFVFDHYIRGLSEQASYEFVKQEATDRGVDCLHTAGDQVMKLIFDVTHGMPLAMKLVVSQFIAGVPLDVELKRLKDATDDDLYKFLYMKLWLKISPSAKKVLIAVATFSSSVTRSMLQLTSATNDEEFDRAVIELTRTSLLEPSGHLMATERRYSIHPITRWFINAPLHDLWERDSQQNH